MPCAICETRKEKRFCPALHARICPQCCGESRETTLDCPLDCTYLRQAHEHEGPRPQSEIDRASIFPDVKFTPQFVHEREPLLVGLSAALTAIALRDRALNDRDLIGALESLARTYETLTRSGLVYEQPAGSPAQQAIAAELQKMVAEYRAVEQQQLGYSKLRDSEVLTAFVFLVRMAQLHTSGRARSRRFIAYLMQRFPHEQAAGAAETGGLIIP